MATTNVTFWAYNWYIMNNPHKTSFTKEDIHKMALLFANTNTTEITTATDPGGTYTGIEWPGSNVITAVGNTTTHTEPGVLGNTKTGIIDWELVNQASKATLDQATYPESHQHH